MAKLTSKQRAKIPKAEFGLPAERKYPMPDAAHAANTKARASQQQAAGRLTVGQVAQIDAMANRKLGNK